MFAQSPAVTVTAINPLEPVVGGIVGFAVTPVGGASATLSAPTAVISKVQGVPQAVVSATAGATPGTFLVTATTVGAPAVGFVLTNTPALGLTLRPGPVTPVPTTNTQPPSSTQPISFTTVVVTGGLNGLRAAIAYANSHPGPDTIKFDPAIFGTKHHTIRVTGGPLVLTDPATTTIIGPGARLLTFRGNGKSRVFDVHGGSLALSGISVTGGRANRGGGIRNDDGTLWLTDVIIRNNSARRSGGGLFNSGTATLTDVVVRGNHARTGENVANFGTLSLTRVTVPGNSARLGPGLFGSLGRTLARRLPPQMARG